MNRTATIAVAVGAGIVLAIGAGAAMRALHKGPHGYGHRGHMKAEDFGGPQGGLSRAFGTLAGLPHQGDGVITRAEVDAGLKQRFDAADPARSGALTLAAFQAAEEARAQAAFGRTPGADRLAIAFNRLDWNKDGALSFEEYAAPVRVAAQIADKDGDGVIRLDRPPHKPRRPGPPDPPEAPDAPPAAPAAPPPPPPPPEMEDLDGETTL